MAVIEPQTQVHSHRYAPAHTFNEADQVHGLPTDRHEVDEPYGSLIGIEFRFQHHGVAAVPPARCADWAGRSDQPTSVFFGAKQGSEDCARVESGYAQPVDGPVAANQRCCLSVADNRVILNRQGQGDLLVSETHHQCEVTATSSVSRTSNPWLHCQRMYGRQLLSLLITPELRRCPSPQNRPESDASTASQSRSRDGSWRQLDGQRDTGLPHQREPHGSGFARSACGASCWESPYVLSRLHPRKIVRAEPRPS